MQTETIAESKHTETSAEKTAARITYLDVMKGIGILLVCLGHCIGDVAGAYHPINRFILSFHMPLFFFVSGLLFEKTANKKFSVFLVRKIWTILLPLLVYVACEVFVEVFIDVFWRQSKTFVDIDWLGKFTSWFIWTIFFMQLLLYGCNRLMERVFASCSVKRGKTYAKAGLLVVFTVGFLLCSYKGIPIFQQVLGAGIFGTLGWLIGGVVENYAQKQKLHGIGCVLLPLIIVLSYYNKPILMYINDYGNKYMFIFTAILGCLCALDISMFLREHTILRFFGQNSMIVFVTHFSVRVVLNLIIARIPFLQEAAPYVRYWCAFFALMLIETIIVLFINKFMPELFGKRRS